MIFQGFRRFLEAIKALTSTLDQHIFALQELATIQRDLGPALDRLEVLERERHNFEAECEGMLLKADGKLKAAASAEQRERQLKKANDRLADPFRDESEAEPEGLPVPRNDVPGSEAQRLRALPLVLATNSKTAAVRAKFGL